MQKIYYFIFLLFVSTLFSCNTSARSYDFTFVTADSEEKESIIIRYEIYENQPFGFSPNQVKVSTLNQEEKISLSLRGREYVIFEVVFQNDPKRISFPISFYRKDLEKRSTNVVQLAFYEQKEQSDYKSLTQLIEFFRQQEYTQHLIKKDRNTFNIDEDLPVGSLIFYDGEKAYFAPTVGIVGEESLERLNERNYVLQDLIKVEQNAGLDVNAQLGGFFSGLTANADMSKVRFMDYRLEIVNLSKRKVKNYLKSPNSIFELKDPWLEAVFEVLEQNQNDIGKYKLYFVTSKIVADTVKLKRRIYRKTAGGGGVNLTGIVINVAGDGNYESEKSFTELDQFTNLYFNFEVQDLTLLLMYEFRKRINEQQKKQFYNQKRQLERELINEKEKVRENFELVRIYDDNLPIENPSYIQIKSIYLKQAIRLPREPKVDSLGNPVEDLELISYNRKVESFNKFLEILQGNLKKCQSLEEKIAAVDILIQQLGNQPYLQDVPETPSKNLDNEIMQNIEEKSPNK